MNLWIYGICIFALIGQGCTPTPRSDQNGQKSKSSKDAPFPDEPSSPPQST